MWVFELLSRLMRDCARICNKERKINVLSVRITTEPQLQVTEIEEKWQARVRRKSPTQDPCTGALWFWWHLVALPR